MRALLQPRGWLLKGVLRRPLLVPQRLNRIQPAGLPRRIDAEEDADDGAEADGEEDGPEGDMGRGPVAGEHGGDEGADAPTGG